MEYPVYEIILHSVVAPGTVKFIGILVSEGKTFTDNNLTVMPCATKSLLWGVLFSGPQTWDYRSVIAKYSWGIPKAPNISVGGPGGTDINCRFLMIRVRVVDTDDDGYWTGHWGLNHVPDFSSKISPVKIFHYVSKQLQSWNHFSLKISFVPLF